MFYRQWSLVESVAPITDVNSQFSAWKADNGSRYKGMRHTATGKPHGIVRGLSANNDIIECSFKEGKYHGLYRFISDHKVYVALFQEDTRLAYMWFDHNFTEIVREGTPE